MSCLVQSQISTRKPSSFRRFTRSRIGRPRKSISELAASVNGTSLNCSTILFCLIERGLRRRGGSPWNVFDRDRFPNQLDVLNAGPASRDLRRTPSSDRGARCEDQPSLAASEIGDVFSGRCFCEVYALSNDLVSVEVELGHVVRLLKPSHGLPRGSSPRKDLVRIGLGHDVVVNGLQDQERRLNEWQALPEQAPP